ncbi:MAG: succinate dehydrogenase cytochrome b subunit [Spirochaetia bacterium]|nr:succinate dehydrogenase cytochrome b subunit [Spirochaetia bacterium]
MNVFFKMLSAPTGKKALMAVSGGIWIGFLLVHLLGNLQILFGQDAMNQYAHFLQNLGSVKWIARSIFLISFILHVILAAILKFQNSSARPEGYTKHNTIRATLASRSMALSGLAILSFIIYHILHYTLGTVHSEYFGQLDSEGRHDVYFMVTESFKNPWITLAYITAILFVSLHLSHAFSSMFQTLGLNGPRTEALWKSTGYFLAAIVLFGYSAIPIAAIYGLI